LVLILHTIGTTTFFIWHCRNDSGGIRAAALTKNGRRIATMCREESRILGRGVIVCDRVAV
jgi:hypothetical protein